MHISISQRLGTIPPSGLEHACEWAPDELRFFVDDRKFYTYKNERKGPEQWPFDKAFHVILNVAVGGTWAARRGVDDAAFPAAMEVAFVKVFQRNPEDPAEGVP